MRVCLKAYQLLGGFETHQEVSFCFLSLPADGYDKIIFVENKCITCGFHHILQIIFEFSYI